MTRKWTVAAIVLVGFAIADTHQAQGGFINGVTATASSAEAPASNLVNYAKPSYDAVNNWVISTGEVWNTANGVSKDATWVKFDVGEVKDLAQMTVFNYASFDGGALPQNRRFVTADIWYCDSTPTVDTPTDASPGNWVKFADDYAFAQASAYNPTSAAPYKSPTVVSLDVSAQYVLMNDVVNGGETVWGNGYGLHTVGFSPVPEPASLTLLTGAGLFGLLCYAWRKSR